MQIDIRGNVENKISQIIYADDCSIIIIYETDSIVITDEEESEVSVELADLDNLIIALERAKDLLLEKPRLGGGEDE